VGRNALDSLNKKEEKENMQMRMTKYVIKRIILMLFTMFVITTMCFILIRLLPRELPTDKVQAEAIKARWEALGYGQPILVQYGIYLRNIFTEGDFGTSWYIQFREPALNVLTSRLLPTVMVNFSSLILSIPVGICLGIYAAIKKNKWQDSVISTGVMIFVSVPSYVYAFLVQYFLYFKLGWLPLQVYSLADAGGSWFTWKMFYSMIAPILALSFGEVAGLCRFTRAELTETLTSDYMLLARTKGLTRAQATSRHAMKNAMVPILPMLIGSFVSVLSGSMVIEQIFSIPGVGQLYMTSINLFDYDVFMVDMIFYVFIGLLAGILVDISYGFIDPRIRMGEK
jgi:oligopeptide transport system permease protein